MSNDIKNEISSIIIEKLNEIFKCKSNKTCTEYVYWKLNSTALMKNQIRYNKQKDMFCSWIERPGKRPVLPKLVIQV